VSQTISTRAERDPRRGMIPFVEVCDLLGIHRNTGYAWLRAGRFPIPVERPGPRLYKCRQTDVERYLASRIPAAV
jgi:excisionase family DNA binding protein